MNNFDRMRELTAELFDNWRKDAEEAVQLIAGLGELRNRMIAAEGKPEHERKALAQEAILWLDKWEPVKRRIDNRDMIASLAMVTELEILKHGRAGIEAKLNSLSPVDGMYFNQNTPYVRRADES